MKARSVEKPQLPEPGMVLAQNAGPLAKGTLLATADIGKLRELTLEKLHVVEMEPGDVHEIEAGRRLATAAAGEGVAVKELNAGSWPLAAKHRGLVEVDEARLARLNDSDDLAVVTLPRGQIVVEGEVIARAKVVPFVTREDLVRRAEQIGAVMQVRPFVKMRVAALVQENLDDAALGKFRDALGRKLAFFGSQLVEVTKVSDAVAALRASAGKGAQLIVMAGSKLMDPLDPALQSLQGAGAKLEKQGVPLHPGTLIWLARLGETTIVGAPGCALFARPTAFDLLLPRLLAGDRLSRGDLAQLGAGGLITDQMAFRFPPYDTNAPRGQLA